jgi:peptide chain release factor 2
MKEFSSLKDIVTRYNFISSRLEESGSLLEMCKEGKDDELIKEINTTTVILANDIEALDLETIFTSTHDSQNVFLTVHAGAGGTDACDWTSILLRMYTRWLEKNKFKYSLVDHVADEEAGIKNATLYVEGDKPFGHLKSEIGVHRLVRISPFNVSHKRHTSFASVDVVPEVEDTTEELKDSDLSVETFRSGGKGGQHVNKTESAVRITHIPTGITVSCQSERSQHINKRTAMAILTSKLSRYYEAEQKKELKAFLGEKGEISFGGQIRSYVLDPYNLVKDHRTGYETGNVAAVLDGEIDRFIHKFLRWPKRWI